MSLNKVMLIGRLGQKPEVKTTSSGLSVATMSMATSEKWNGQNGEKVEKTEWHRVVAFKKLAEISSEFLDKGSQVYIEGRLQTRSWDDKNGVKRYTTEIMAEVIKFLDSRSGEKKDVATKREFSPGDFDNDDIPF